MFDQFGAVKFEVVWEVFLKRSYWMRRASTSSALSSRKACSNSSVRMEMMWSAGAGGLVVFLGVGVVPNS